MRTADGLGPPADGFGSGHWYDGKLGTPSPGSLSRNIKESITNVAEMFADPWGRHRDTYDIYTSRYTCAPKLISSSHHHYQYCHHITSSSPIPMTLYPPLPQSCPPAFSRNPSAIGVGSPEYSPSDQQFHFAPCGMELCKDMISPIYQQPRPSHQFNAFGNFQADEQDKLEDSEMPSRYEATQANCNDSLGGMVSLSGKN